ncbi:MAG: TPR domain protein [Candidatus Ozemobacter sibiricus]|uniref:TPR domain protein n=1 Tax=Candidatus Ozemobacter sibiricus TaxID=2268124 RepID=A0A367ZAY8_9BACT|nr:MAG: TPR domain protein [Candidatus Ozemobacter sibiricus]
MAALALGLFLGTMGPARAQEGDAASDAVPLEGTAGEPIRPSGSAGAAGPTVGGAADGPLARDETPGPGATARGLTPAQLEARIEKMRSLLDKTPDNGEARSMLAELLVQKALSMRGQAVAEIEPLLSEAADLAPDDFRVPHLWGDLYFGQRHFEAAIGKFELALALRPDHLDSLMKLGISLMNSMRYEDALSQFEKARQQIPNDFYLLFCTGRCHFELRDFDRAITVWEEALKRAPDRRSAEAVQQLIRQAKEQEASTGGGTRDENQRFIVHYAGNSQQDIGDMTMEILEEIYDQVTSDLGYKPDIQITIIFYRTEEFYELNKAGSWVGAMARGEKILVPLRQGYSDLRSVKGTLAHEFTHVIVNLRTNNRCPVWINEGLAVYQEFQAANGDPTQMRSDYERFFNKVMQGTRSFGSLRDINLNPLQGAYGDHIPLGYLQSYLSMRFMIERYGWQGVDALLGALGQGEGLDGALTAACNLSFAEFEREFNDWLKGL